MTLRDAYPTLLRALRQAGLDPDRLHPWRAWRVFRASLRAPPAPGEHAAYVGLGADHAGDGAWHVTFVRQLAVWEPKLTGSGLPVEDRGITPELNVVRAIVIDLVYDARPELVGDARKIVSGDFSTLKDFIAVVESDPGFRAAMAGRCVGSLVYEDEV